MNKIISKYNINTSISSVDEHDKFAQCCTTRATCMSDFLVCFEFNFVSIEDSIKNRDVE